MELPPLPRFGEGGEGGGMDVGSGGGGGGELPGDSGSGEGGEGGEGGGLESLGGGDGAVLESSGGDSGGGAGGDGGDLESLGGGGVGGGIGDSRAARSTGSHCGGHATGWLTSTSLLATLGVVVCGMKATLKRAAMPMRTRVVEAWFLSWLRNGVVWAVSASISRLSAPPEASRRPVERWCGCSAAEASKGPGAVWGAVAGERPGLCTVASPWSP